MCSKRVRMSLKTKGIEDACYQRDAHSFDNRLKMNGLHGRICNDRRTLRQTGKRGGNKRSIRRGRLGLREIARLSEGKGNAQRRRNDVLAAHARSIAHV